LRLQLAADDLVGLQDGHYVFDTRDRAQVLQVVFVIAVTDCADDNALFASYDVRFVAVSAYALADFFDLLFGCA
jgi:hypothetical protein